MAKVKTKKCALKTCRVEFVPKPFWQKYHKPKCAWTANNQKNAKLIRKAKKNIEAEEGAA